LRVQREKLVAPARNQQHFARGTIQRAIAPAIIRLFDDETGHDAKFGESSRRVEPDAVLALAGTAWTAPA
jgi:hypothetical protein